MLSLTIVIVLSGISVRGQTTSPKLSLNQSFAYFNDCSFSSKNFNPTCVSQSCPNLDNICPYTPTGNAYASTALSDCLQRPNASICGVTIAQVPICSFEANLTGVSSIATGNCALTQGSTYGLNNATFNVTGSGPLTVTINATNITSAGTYECTFTLFNGGPITTFSAPQLHVQSTLAINATLTLDLSTQPPTVNTTLHQSDIDFQCTNFNGLSKLISNQLTSGVGAYYKESGNDWAAVNILSNYVVSALQKAQPQNCTTN